MPAEMSSHRTRRALVAALLALAVTAVPAVAKTHHYKNFHSPSKLIGCFLLKFEGKGVECTAGYLPRYGPEGDSYMHVEPHGKATTGTRSDYPGYEHVKDRVLHYGDANAKRGIKCSMAQTGLTCRNLDGHGFHMARGNSYLF